MSPEPDQPSEKKYRYLLAIKMVESFTSISNNLVKYGGIGICSFFVYKISSVLADKETNANINLGVSGFDSLIKGNKAACSVAVLFGVGGVIYGLLQRRAKNDVVEQMHKQVKDSELLVDPHRSSSDLTPRGETRPEDE